METPSSECLRTLSMTLKTFGLISSVTLLVLTLTSLCCKIAEEPDDPPTENQPNLLPVVALLDQPIVIDAGDSSTSVTRFAYI